MIITNIKIAYTKRNNNFHLSIPAPMVRQIKDDGLALEGYQEISYDGKEIKITIKNDRSKK